MILKADRERWNDWGIGMLLQGDIKGAEYAFTTTTQAEPEYSDGWLNLARALIQEGETDAAKPHIQKAIELNPAAGRNYFFRAMVEKADGDYPAAIASLRRVVQQYPRDRVALNQLARILFLSREYTESLKVLAEVGKVDPEDLQMHYTAMLAHRGAGNLEAAARAETLFKRFKAEESAQAITGDRRRAKPEENNERQMIHEHEGSAAAARAQMKALAIVTAIGLSAAALLAQPFDSAQGKPGRVQFTDVTAASGIKFTHNSGKLGRKWLPETMGSGAAFFDVDGDGWLDVFLVNSRDWTPRAGRRSLSALYRNTGAGKFTNITAGSGLDVELYGMGVAAADYDNDGRQDLYVTALEGDRLFQNLGGGKFKDVTKAAGIANANFGTSAAWLDYDKDGHLDLFVANYVQWTQQTDIWCSLDGVEKSYCTPESYKGTASKLYRNLGGGKFEDASAKAGIADPTQQVARHRRARLQHGRLARHVRRQRHAAEQAVSQQPQRHLHRGRHTGGRRLQRGRRGARRDGRRCSGLRSLGPSAPDRRQLLEPDARPLSQRGQEPVRGRGAAVLDRPRQPAVAGLRRVLLRLRPRRLLRHPLGERAHRRGD